MGSDPTFENIVCRCIHWRDGHHFLQCQTTNYPNSRYGQLSIGTSSSEGVFAATTSSQLGNVTICSHSTSHGVANHQPYQQHHDNDTVQFDISTPTNRLLHFRVLILGWMYYPVLFRTKNRCLNKYLNYLHNLCHDEHSQLLGNTEQFHISDATNCLLHFRALTLDRRHYPFLSRTKSRTKNRYFIYLHNLLQLPPESRQRDACRPR